MYGKTGGGSALPSLPQELFDATVRVVILAYKDRTPRFDVKTAARKLIASGKFVFLVVDNPELPRLPVECDPRPFGALTDRESCAIPRAKIDAERRQIRSDYADMVARYPSQTQVLDAPMVLCGPEACAYHDDVHYFYDDREHLNALGADALAKAFIPEINSALGPKPQTAH